MFEITFAKGYTELSDTHLDWVSAAKEAVTIAQKEHTHIVSIRHRPDYPEGKGWDGPSD